MTVGGVLAGCATAQAPAPPTSLTSAEVSRPSTSDVSAARAADEASPPSELPAGQLACRTKQLGSTTELFLDWDGGAIAKGVLRTVTPSGMVHVQRVRGERYKGAIFADDPSDGDWDLVCHTAVVAQRDGRPYMRVGEGEQRWTACE